MLANKLFPLLSRPEVQEIVLITGKPPCALVGGSYRRLSSQTLRDEDILAVVAAARGQDRLPQLAQGTQWEFQLPSVGKIAIAAGYEGAILRMTLRLNQSRSVRDMPAVNPAQPTAAARPADIAQAPRPPAPPVAPAAQRHEDVFGARAGVASAQRNEDASGARAGAGARQDDAEPGRAAAAGWRNEDAFAARGGAASQEDPSAGRAGAAGVQRNEDMSGARGSALGRPHGPLAGRGAPAGRLDDLPAGRGGGPVARLDAPQPLAAGYAQPPATTGHQPLPPTAAGPLTSPLIALDEPRYAPPARAQAPAQPASTGSDLLDELLGRARERAASDLHVLADRPVMLRVAGELVAQSETPTAEQAERMLRARVPEALRATLDEHGSCDFSLTHEHYGRFRANVSRQRTGYKLTARPIGQTVPTLEQLGLPESIAGALDQHQGLIVITGPTGHGKTTTLSALVGILNRETAHHVITVEDPIEYVHETAKAVLSQREVGSHTKTFAAALKGALREDPDVIVVGELRDTETVRMALSASETGHLVISTMNTPSAAKAIERLIDLFPPGDQPQVRMTLAGGLRLIVSQRLLPTSDRQQLCAAAEVLPGNTPLWNLIRENRTYQIASLQQRGKSLGIVRLDDSLAELVKKQRTTLEIAREYAESADLLETMVLGKKVVPEAQPENSNDLQKRGMELGKQVMSRAGKLFGGETK